MIGKLYIVATPIGNMGDMTLRAVEILKTAHLLLSEDTRETAKILRQFGISTKQISYRDQNHDRLVPKLLEMLNFGLDLALVTDSGTPLVSDPGYKLVRELYHHNIKVVPIPGVSSVTTALSMSPLPTDKFCFLGFLPKADIARKKLLTQYGALDCTLVIFESPFRIEKLLSEVLACLGNRFVFIARELTKIHESVYVNTASELLATWQTSGPKKGEHIVLIAKQAFQM